MAGKEKMSQCDHVQYTPCNKNQALNIFEVLNRK
jgi:hypothetical protein